MRIEDRQPVRVAQRGTRRGSEGFTLIEILAASMALALLLTAVYGVFSRASQLRDGATVRTQEARVQARALSLLRDDLRNAHISGGLLAAELRGSVQSPVSRFPGYLRLTATTGQNQTNALFGDIQEVEYYIVDDPVGTDRNAGLLVRAVDRNLLAPVRSSTHQEALLAGVQSLEIAFLEGQNWTDAWEFSDSDSRLPEAIRVRLRLSNRPGEQRASRTIEVLTPWTLRGPDDGEEASGSVPNGSGGGGGGGPEGGGGGAGGGGIIPGGGPVR
jgi:prepilin-type N-terminal cleavage/methylation domain-containing protein